jgi:hypothetical protein
MLYKNPHFQRPFDTSFPTTFSWHRNAFANSALIHTESFGRLCVGDGDVDAWPRILAEAIDGVPSNFILNMDKMGHEEYGDAKQVQCAVPVHVTSTKSYEPSHRGKRITLVACIAADGSCLRPAPVITRAAFDDELVEYGLTPEKLEILPTVMLTPTGTLDERHTDSRAARIPHSSRLLRTCISHT